MSKQLQTYILISRDLVYFTTVVGKFNISSCWHHWCNFSSKEWSDESHSQETLWIIDLMKVFK